MPVVRVWTSFFTSVSSGQKENKEGSVSEEKFRQNVWFQSVTKTSVLTKIKPRSHPVSLRFMFLVMKTKSDVHSDAFYKPKSVRWMLSAVFSRINNNQIIVNRMPPVNTR